MTSGQEPDEAAATDGAAEAARAPSGDAAAPEAAAPAAGPAKEGRAGRLWWLLPVLILLASVGTAGFLLTRPDEGQLQLVDCQATAPEDYQCWSDRLRYLAENDTPLAALQDAEAAGAASDFVTTHCHQFAHEIGRSAGHRYDTISEAFRHGNEFCASGYFHGVMEAYADIHGDEYILSRGAEVCAGVKAERPYAVNHFNCAHGLGHGLMAVVRGELYEALDGCDNMADAWESSSCYGGVFMENIMSRIMEYSHHDSRYLRDDEPLYPCTEVAENYKEQCYIIQTGFVLNVYDYDFEASFEVCRGAEAGWIPTCMRSMGRDISGYTIHDKARTIELCSLAGTDEYLQHCLIGAAKDYVFHYADDAEALALCGFATKPEMVAACEGEVTAYFGTF